MVLHWAADEIAGAHGDYLTLRAATAFRWNNVACRDGLGRQQNRMSHLTVEELLFIFGNPYMAPELMCITFEVM